MAADGRIHATFRQTVARTGRLSSDRPNLHNIPVRTEQGKQFRRAFVPSAGGAFLVADYDQVELRAIAHLSGDPGLIGAFAAGEDIHRTVAARVFGVDRATRSRTRAAIPAKMVSYGLAYGMEAYGLAQRLGVPVEEAKGILEAFFDAFPSVQRLHGPDGGRGPGNGLHRDRLRPACGRCPTCMLVQLPGAAGRRAPGHERRHPGAGRRPLQAGPGPARPGLEEGGYCGRLVLQVHDEVLVEVEPDEADAVRRAHRGGPDRCGRPRGPPQGLHGAGGPRWAEAKG